MIATKFGTLLISLYLPQSLAPCGSKVYKIFFQHRLKPLSAKSDGMADISAAQSAESATEPGDTARTIQVLEEKLENCFNQLIGNDQNLRRRVAQPKQANAKHTLW